MNKRPYTGHPGITLEERIPDAGVGVFLTETSMILTRENRIDTVFLTHRQFDAIAATLAEYRNILKMTEGVCQR